MPNNNCKLNNNERMLEPGKTMIYSCIFEFESPYEKLLLKGFASNKPINFKSTVETRGVGTETRGSFPNPLESFIGNSYAQSRGGSGSEVSGKIDGYSTEFIYEIVKNKQ